MGGVLRAMVAAALLAVLAAAAPLRADVLEYTVKAEFIERFTHFIDWPSQAFTGTDGPFVFCVIGDSPLVPYLERLTQQRRIKDRRAELKRLKWSDDASGCHMLLIAADERAHAKQILSRVSGKPILTVGDSEGFAQLGVIINLLLDEEGHVRFEMNAPQAKRSGLNISAQLLRLARLVTEDGS
jgi:hypothetical protein